MTLSPQTVIFVSIMILIVGFAVGWMAGGSRGSSEKPSNDAPPGGRKGAYIPLVKLWREKTGTRLVVEFEEKAYISREPLQPAQLQRLRRLVADFSAWAGLANVLADTPPVAKTPVAEPPPVATSIPAPEATPITEPVSNPVRPPVVVPIQPTQPAVEKPKSITGQIDEILQEMLIHSPLEDRGIKLIENARSGVVVWVGKESFDGIGAVPYPEVTEMIRNAVKEWEKRAG